MVSCFVVSYNTNKLLVYAEDFEALSTIVKKRGFIKLILISIYKN